jgi:para-aminobenzoate synthetase component 1
LTQTENETQPSLFRPIVHRLSADLDVRHCFERLATLPHLLVLESSMRHETLGQYSYLMADPIAFVTPESIQELRSQLDGHGSEHVQGMPSFQGGLAGLVSYEYNRKIEAIEANQYRDFDIPALAFGLYDVVLAFDQARSEAWLISQGFSESSQSLSDRHARASQRAEEFLTVLQSEPPRCESNSESAAFFTLEPASGPATSSRKAASELAPQYPVPGPEGLTSNFNKPQYLTAAKKCIDYIYAGDVFQINLSQRLLAPAHCDSPQLYQRMRNCNPATFSGYFDLGDSQIVSASPERFVSVHDGIVETRPIKGTRKRTRIPQFDLAVSQQLLSSEKDRAENIMIVDLMRNDLSRVCTDDSIEVTQLCELEKYQSVFHLVSAIQGKLRPEYDAFDVLEATFPGGSITGAPKVRAMEIIAELEPTARGAYCGSLGYIDINGDADFNILIRTVTATDGWWQVPVGGGLVAQSDPNLEYEETWTKAASMLAAIATKDPA